ncbi:MAG TPA: hypothetical protein PLU49_14460 [Saprospiraceae bacterium]|nr:hypothetical protein [Saprospiraceae bacterium]
MEIFYILIALISGSVGSAALAGLMLLFNDQKLENLATYLMYLAGGTLLGAAFLGMIPKAISMSDPKIILNRILFGILLFFLLEKIYSGEHVVIKIVKDTIMRVRPLFLPVKPSTMRSTEL